MIETGRVKRIDAESILIRCKPAAACHSCGKGGCGAAGRDIRVKNPHSYGLQLGDFVEVYLPTAQAVRAGFLVFIFPLGLFLAAYLSAGFFFGAATEAVSVLTGLGGLAAGLAVAYFSAKKSAKLPEISRLLTAEDLLRESCLVSDEDGGPAEQG